MECKILRKMNIQGALNALGGIDNAKKIVKKAKLYNAHYYHIDHKKIYKVTLHFLKEWDDESGWVMCAYSHVSDDGFISIPKIEALITLGN